MYKVVAICRYSVLVKNKTAWRAGVDKSWDEYKSEVLNPVRLDMRLCLFNNITLPSLLSSRKAIDKNWFTLVILVSDLMPKQQLNNLENCVVDLPWCRIVPIAERADLDQEVTKNIGEVVADNDEVYATLRLDDDDALSRDYFDRLIPYVSNAHLDHAISFPFGYQAYYNIEKQSYRSASEMWEPKLALGLAYISNKKSTIKHALQLGSHTTIDQRHPLVTIPGGPMYIRTFHDYNDVFLKIPPSERMNKIKYELRKGRLVDVVSVQKYFGLQAP